MTDVVRRWSRQFPPLLRVAIRTAPLRLALARNAVLLRAMTRRDLAARYRGSMLGIGWALLTPFLMMALYTTVFAVFLRMRLSADASPLAFALYLLAGLLPWTAFAEAAGRATGVMLEHQNLVKKVVFPLEIIPLSATCGALVNHAIALGIFLIAVLALRGWSPTLLLLPLVLAPLVLLSAGVSLLLASLGVFLRDFGQVIGLILTAWLFLTPIMYPQDLVPARFQPFIRANPFTAIVEGYRRVILDGSPPDPVALTWLYAVTILICIAGFWWFRRTKAIFADVL